MKKRWFTLIEMMLVIVIIAILLALSIWISGNRVQWLKVKSIQEQFVHNYNNVYLKNMLTNYYSWTIYDKMTVNFAKWEDKIGYFYSNYPEDVQYAFAKEWMYEINQIFLDERLFDFVKVNFTPYTLWCEIADSTGNTWKNLLLNLLINSKEYCFKINHSLCRLEKTDCD